ncbi:unnamed protein product [Leptosia nina]|uniref:Uncharacterized protein n=1 Tax=Leptosia nina TaxID=320188 RepID=A0AAV1ISG5_9NEOP
MEVVYMKFWGNLEMRPSRIRCAHPFMDVGVHILEYGFSVCTSGVMDECGTSGVFMELGAILEWRGESDRIGVMRGGEIVGCSRCV